MLIRFSILTKKKSKSLTIKVRQWLQWYRKLSNRKKGSKQRDKCSDTKHQLENNQVSHMVLVCLMATSWGSLPSNQASLEELQVDSKDQDWRRKKGETCGRSQRHSTTSDRWKSNIKIRQRACCPLQPRTLDSATRAGEPCVVTCREVVKTSWIAWKTLLPSIISKTTFRAKSRLVEGSSVRCLTTSYHMSRLTPWAPLRVVPASSDKLTSSDMLECKITLKLPKSTNLTNNLVARWPAVISLIVRKLVKTLKRTRDKS